MRVIFRALFQGLKDTGRFKFPNPPALTVDVFRKGHKWFARSGQAQLKLQGEPTHGTMKDAVAGHFETQLSEWQMVDQTAGIPLLPDMVEEDPKGNFTRVELTHLSAISNAQSSMGANYFKTICGVEVHVHQIRSSRAHKPPSCPICKTEWEKTPAEERFKA